MLLGYHAISSPVGPLLGGWMEYIHSSTRWKPLSYRSDTDDRWLPGFVRSPHEPIVMLSPQDKNSLLYFPPIAPSPLDAGLTISLSSPPFDSHRHLSNSTLFSSDSMANLAQCIFSMRRIDELESAGISQPGFLCAVSAKRPPPPKPAGPKSLVVKAHAQK